MKKTSLILILLFVTSTIFAKGNFFIQPKGYVEPNISGQVNKNSGLFINKVGGHFRLKEYSTLTQQWIEADVVTYFLSKNNDGLVSFQINCAKAIQLHFTFSDGKAKHDLQIAEQSTYQRFNKLVDLSDLNDGICEIKVFNENNELIKTIEFEKVSLK